MQLKRIILITLFTSLTSCLPPPAHLINEFQGFPEGLSKKEFIEYNLKRSDEMNKEYISFREWHRKNGYRYFNEFSYFDLTYFNPSNEHIINESVKSLSELKKARWVTPSIFEEVYGKQVTFWVSKEEILRINKIQDENLGRLYESTQLYLNKAQSKSKYQTYKWAQNLKNRRLQK